MLTINSNAIDVNLFMGLVPFLGKLSPEDRNRVYLLAKRFFQQMRFLWCHDAGLQDKTRFRMARLNSYHFFANTWVLAWGCCPSIPCAT
ncbi:MAG: hypothetical protein KDH08_17040, partial [Anaerolineae bacterium]|nr:hypothetical protein [Anaerolineae bacterium]